MGIKKGIEIAVPGSAGEKVGSIGRPAAHVGDQACSVPGARRLLEGNAIDDVVVPNGGPSGVIEIGRDDEVVAKRVGDISRGVDGGWGSPSDFRGRSQGGEEKRKCPSESILCDYLHSLLVKTSRSLEDKRKNPFE